MIETVLTMKNALHKPRTKLKTALKLKKCVWLPEKNDIESKIKTTKII